MGKPWAFILLHLFVWKDPRFSSLTLTIISTDASGMPLALVTERFLVTSSCRFATVVISWLFANADFEVVCPAAASALLYWAALCVFSIMHNGGKSGSSHFVLAICTVHFYKGAIYVGSCITSKIFFLLQLCKCGRPLPASVELAQHLSCHGVAACVGEKVVLFEQQLPFRWLLHDGWVITSGYNSIGNVFCCFAY